MLSNPVGSRRLRMPRPSRGLCAVRKVRGKRAEQERSDGLRAGRRGEREPYLETKPSSDLRSEATAFKRARIMRKRASGVATNGQRKQWPNTRGATVTFGEHFGPIILEE